MGLKLFFMSLQWVSMGFHGSPMGFHGSSWVSMDLQWVFMSLQWVSNGSPMGLRAKTLSTTSVTLNKSRCFSCRDHLLCCGDVKLLHMFLIGSGFSVTLLDSWLLSEIPILSDQPGLGHKVAAVSGKGKKNKET